MILNETFRMANGVEIPKLGLGTWDIPDGKAAQAVRDAVKVGYRHIDTAQGYGNERGVGEGVRSCGITREEIFVTTKLDGNIKDYKTAVSAIDGSLNTMELDYIDLMIIHSPQPWAHFREDEHWFDGNLEAWRALEEAYKAGKLRAIGVSNFEKEDLANIIQNGTVLPAVNQILAHIGNMPFELIDYTKKQGVLVEAYSPIAHGEILSNESIAKIAAKYGATVPQLCIRYCLQLGLLPLPKTANIEHMKSNAKVGFTIYDDDMAALGALSVRDYGSSAIFPVFSGKLMPDGSYQAGEFKERK
ncbi:MAG: aldo/keto reductase [Christensenellales bacterium]